MKHNCHKLMIHFPHHPEDSVTFPIRAAIRIRFNGLDQTKKIKVLN